MDQASISRRSVLNDATQGLLRQILESDGPHVSFIDELNLQAEKRSFAKMQQVYRCCMDEAGIAEKGLGPLLEIMASIQHAFQRGSVNVLQGATDSTLDAEGAEKRAEDIVSRDYTEVVKYLMNRGVEAFISFRTKVLAFVYCSYLVRC
jgi:predicted metalloendopeptidase